MPMLASILEAPQQVQISSPALPHKSAGRELINGIAIQSILDINVTKRGTVYIRYGTSKGRGCSFVSWKKFTKALEDIQQRRWAEKIGVPVDSCSINHILFGENDRAERLIKFHLIINNTQAHSVKAPVREVAPFLTRWNNQFLISAEEARDSIGMTPTVEHKPIAHDIWKKAQQELNNHIEKTGNQMADFSQFKINRLKSDLSAELAKQNLVGFPFDEDGDHFVKVCLVDKTELGHIIITSEAQVRILSAVEGSKERLVNGVVGAVNGLKAAIAYDPSRVMQSGYSRTKSEEYRRTREYCNQVYR